MFLRLLVWKANADESTFIGRNFTISNNDNVLIYHVLVGSSCIYISHAKTGPFICVASDPGLFYLPLIQQCLDALTCSQMHVYILGHAQQTHSVVTTSLQRHDVAATL